MITWRKGWRRNAPHSCVSRGLGVVLLLLLRLLVAVCLGALNKRIALRLLSLVEVEALLFRAHPEIVDADLADYFGSTPPEVGLT